MEEINYKRDTPLIWRSLKEFNLTDSETCKNSQQGVSLIVDERGFLCSRDDLKSTGCCNIQAENTHIYYCETCDPASNCCEVYEHCVSCCLNPDNVSIKKCDSCVYDVSFITFSLSLGFDAPKSHFTSERSPKAFIFSRYGSI